MTAEMTNQNTDYFAVCLNAIHLNQFSLFDSRGVLIACVFACARACVCVLVFVNASCVLIYSNACFPVQAVKMGLRVTSFIMTNN